MDDADLAGEVVARQEAEALARARRLPPCCAETDTPPCPQHQQARQGRVRARTAGLTAGGDR